MLKPKSTHISAWRPLLSSGTLEGGVEMREEDRANRPQLSSLRVTHAPKHSLSLTTNAFPIS